VLKDFNYASQSYYQIVPSGALGFMTGPSWNVTIGSPIANAAYFIAYYDPTIPGWNVGYEGGAPAATPSPNATNVAYSFTPAPNASPFTLSASGATFALVAITGATPSPAPTITPPPNSTNLIQDPGFETEGAAGAYASNSTGWTPCSDPQETPTPGATLAPAPTLQSAVVHSGSYAALTGATLGVTTSPHEPRGAQGICQTVTLSSTPYLTLWVEEGGNDGSAYIRQEATVLVNGGATEVPLFQDYTCTGKANGQSFDNCTGSDQPIQWVQKGPYTTQLQPYAGQTVTLFIGVWASAYSSSKSYGVYMYVDDVTMF
jgi:hypothetical protein